MELKSKVLEKKGCSVSLELEISSAEVAKTRESVFNKIQNTATVDGFRKGKAPIEMVKSKFKATAERDLIQTIVPHAIHHALEEAKIEPLFYPEVDSLDFTQDGSLKFNIIIETNPEFEVNGYKGLKILEKEAKIDDKDVDDYIQMLLDRSSSLDVDIEGIVKDNSFVLIDYVGKLDGVEFNGGSEKDRLLSIENSGFIEGFSSGLIGAKIGEVRDLNLKFPVEYHVEDLKGKDVVFNVTLKEIKKKVSPILTEEYVSKFGAKSIEDFRENIKSFLLKEKESANKKEIENSIIDQLIDLNKIDVSQKLIEEEAKKILENTKKEYESYGYKNFNLDNLKDTFYKNAEKNIKAFYILNEIVKKENLEATEEDFANKKNQDIVGNDPQKIEEYYVKNKQNILNIIRQEKLFSFLIENGKK